LKRRGSGQIAQTLSRQKALKINSLHVYDGHVTGNMELRAMCGALVEFPTRAGIGFAGG
jgi:hypothetical protein